MWGRAAQLPPVIVRNQQVTQRLRAGGGSVVFRDETKPTGKPFKLLAPSGGWCASRHHKAWQRLAPCVCQGQTVTGLQGEAQTCVHGCALPDTVTWSCPGPQPVSVLVRPPPPGSLLGPRCSPSPCALLLQELLQEFESEMQKRERGFRLQADSLSHAALTHELQVTAPLRCGGPWDWGSRFTQRPPPLQGARGGTQPAGPQGPW